MIWAAYFFMLLTFSLLLMVGCVIRFGGGAFIEMFRMSHVRAFQRTGLGCKLDQFG